jgi:hypothetical protein
MGQSVNLIRYGGNAVLNTLQVNLTSSNSATRVVVADNNGNFFYTSSFSGGGGGVTTLSVVNANGFAGSVANPTTTPAITLSTTITGLLKGNGTAISAATLGTDYISSTVGTASWSQNAINVLGGSANYITRWSSSTTLTTGSIYDNGTNVGIGTITPSAKLDVVGITKITKNAANLQLSGSDHVYIEFYPTNSLNRQAYFGFPSPGSKDFYMTNESTNGHIVLIPGSSGNVGIGATAPAAKLEIKSSAANNLGGLLLRATSTSNFPALLYENSSNGGTLDLYNVASLTTRINSNGGSYFNGGNVGIGTITPSYKLHVADSAFPAMGIFRDVDVTSVGPAGQIIEIGARSGSNFIPAVSIIGGLDNPGSTGNLTFQTRTANVLTSKMFISTNGNIGIGNTSPLQKLHITQAVDTSNPTLGIGKGALFIAGDTNLYGLYVGINTLTGNTYFQAMRNNAATAYDILLNPVGGNVGIGTTSPSVKLEISGSTKINKVVSNSNPTPILSVTGSFNTTGEATALDIDVYNLVSLTSSLMNVKENGVSVFRVRSDGPTFLSSELEVANNIIIKSPGSYLWLNDTVSSNKGYLISTGNSVFSIYEDETYGGLQLDSLANLSVGGNITGSNLLAQNGGVKTSAPIGGYTAKVWKLGDPTTGTCIPSNFAEFSSWFTGTVISIEVDGNTYLIPAVTPNYC